MIVLEPGPLQKSVFGCRRPGRRPLWRSLLLGPAPSSGSAAGKRGECGACSANNAATSPKRARSADHHNDITHNVTSFSFSYQADGRRDSADKDEEATKKTGFSFCRGKDEVAQKEAGFFC